MDSENSASSQKKPFFWGVATSGYQSEGGYNGKNQPLNNWAWAEKEGLVVSSGASADFWNLYQKDFELCHELGLNAFRLSLEWSRIQPVSQFPPSPSMQDPPAFDLETLHRYAEMIAACRQAGMEPIVTLHHFVQPAWLGIDAWLDKKTVAHFIEFVRFSLSYLIKVLAEEFKCLPPRYFITINEPNMLTSNQYTYNIFPSGSKAGFGVTAKCLANLFEAHTRAYELIHELYEGKPLAPMVSFNNYCSDLYWTDGVFTDLFFCAQEKVPEADVLKHLLEKGKAFDREFLSAELFSPWSIQYQIGQLLKWCHHFIGHWVMDRPEIREFIHFLYQQKKVPLDFIALDYYDPFVAHVLRRPQWSDFEPLRRRSLRDWILEGLASKWWDWRVLPEGMAFFVKHASQYELPILIAENGMAHRRLADNTPFPRRDKFARSAFLRKHIAMVTDLVEKGYPIFGYLHWSLFDNYEWGSFTPRFGLYSIDYKQNQIRQPIDAWGDNPSETYAKEIAKARQQLNGNSS